MPPVAASERNDNSSRKSNRNRNVHMHVWVTEDEALLIRDRMASVGVTNMGAYVRKMSLDGFFIHIDLSDVREMVSLLRRCSNNLNQYAKRANETGSIYAADIEDLRERFDRLWDAANEILRGLAKIK